MKKITLISACMLLFTAVNAEQMQFVTTMSAPVGNFARLDAADPTHVTRVGKDGDSSSGYLNFCNTRSGVGDIIIKGAGAYLKQIDIQNGTTLGSTNTPEYRLGENLSIENGGTVTAGRVMANDVTFKDTNFHKSNVTNAIYGNDVAVMGGKTDNMEISGTAKINKSAQNAANLGEELWWDNQYASDYDASGNKKSNGKTYTSFLLKSKTASSSSCEAPNGKKYAVVKQCSCGGELYGTWDKDKCEYVADDYVEMAVNCRTNRCCANQDAHNYDCVDYHGCKLDTPVTFSVYVYYQAAYAYGSSKMWWHKYSYNLTKDYLLEDACGWDGHSGLVTADYLSCPQRFSLSDSGEDKIYKSCGDCQYVISMNQESNDEDWDSSYCNPAHYWF